MSTIVNANDSQTFATEVLQSDLPVLVDFWAAWCGPCRMVAPEVEKIADAHPDELKVVKVDVDANQEVAASYGIFSIPTLGLFRGGQLVAQSVGAKPQRTIESDLGLAGVLEEARR